MPQIVNFADLGELEFPDEATPEQIESAVKSHRDEYVSHFLKRDPSLAERPDIKALINPPLNDMVQVDLGDQVRRAEVDKPFPSIPRGVPGNVRVNPVGEGTSEEIISGIRNEDRVDPAQTIAEALFGLAKGEQPEGIVSPDSVPSGANTSIPAVTIPLSAVGKAGAGLAGYLTSPKGATETALSLIPGIGWAQKGKWIADMASGAGESAGRLSVLIQKPDKTREDWQNIANEAAMSAVQLYGAAHLTSSAASAATGVRAPMTRVLESNPTRMAKDLAQQLDASDIGGKTKVAIGLQDRVAQIQRERESLAPNTVSTEERANPNPPSVGSEIPVTPKTVLETLAPATAEAVKEAINPPSETKTEMPVREIPGEAIQNPRETEFEVRYVTEDGNRGVWRGPAVDAGEAKAAVTSLGRVIVVKRISPPEPRAKSATPTSKQSLQVEPDLKGGESVETKEKGQGLQVAETGPVESPASDLFPDLKGRAPTLERVRRAIDTAESDLKEKYDAATGEDVPTDSPLHDLADRAQARVDKLRKLALELEKKNLNAAKSAPATQAETPTLLEFAKSKLPKSVAEKLTNESQAESYRAQWEKEFGKPTTPAATGAKVETPAKSQPEMTGMGAAVPSEFEKSFRTSTGIKKEAIAEARAERGLDPIEPGTKESQQAIVEQIQQRILDEPQYFDALANELIEKPRPLTSYEVAAMDARYVDLQSEYGKAMRAAELAESDGRTDAVIDAKRQADYWDAKLSEFEHAARATGTHWGRTGAMMRRRMIADYSLEAMESRARKAKNFEPLTDLERAELKTLSEEIKKAEEKVKERESRISELEAQKSMADAIEANRKEPTYAPSVLVHAERFAKFMDKAGEDALARIKSKLARTSAGVDPTLLADVGIYGAAKLSRGMVDLARWTDAMAKDVGEWIREHAQEAYDASKKALEEKENAFFKGASDTLKDKTKRAARKADVTENIEATRDKIEALAAKGETQNLHPLAYKLGRLIIERDKLTGADRGKLLDELHPMLREFIPEITRDETRDAFTGIGVYTLPKTDAVSVAAADLRRQLLTIGQTQRVLERRPVPPTGPQRPPTSDLARREQQIFNEAKRRFGINVASPELQLRSALQAREKYYTDRLADLRAEIKTGERIVKSKSPSPTSPKLEALKAEYEQVKAEHADIFKKPELTDAQRLERAIKTSERAEKQAEETLTRAEKGDFGPKPEGKPLPNSVKLDEIKARTAAMREETKLLKDLANPKKTPEEIALQSAKTRVANQLKELLEKERTGDFSKKEKRTVVPDPELRRARGELEKVQERVRAREEKFKFDQLSPFKKGLKIAGHTYDSARLIMTTGELSFLLRQGKWFVLSHPIKAAKALPEMWRGFWSDAAAKDSELAIRDHPDYEASQKAKLHISREGDVLTKQEEIVMGKWGNFIPVVKNFNRAAVTFLNRIRWEYWQSMRGSLSKMGKPTAAEDAMYARFANESTGRGGLGSEERSAVTLGRMMFSPRYFASRIQLAAGHALWGGTLRSRAVIASEYARSLIGLGIYYSLLNFGFQAMRKKDESDVRLSFDLISSDSGKVIVGDTRIDPLTGFAQLATFSGLTVTGKSKNPQGEVTAIRGKVPYGKRGWWEYAGRFAGSKAHPVPMAVGGLFAGVDLFGNETSITSELGKFSGPITYIDIYQAMKAEGMPEGEAMALLAFLGEGLQTYKKK